MTEDTTIGLDFAKNVFHAHGADERGAMVFSRKLTRGKCSISSLARVRAWLPSKLAAVRITGRASCRRWGTMCG